MKIVMRQIEMIAWFTQDGNPRPLKFKINDNDDSPIIIKIDRVTAQHEEKLAGNKMIVFICQSIINNREKIYELKYELNTCKWFLFKI